MRLLKPNIAILLTIIIMVISVVAKGQVSKQDTTRANISVKTDTNSVQKDTTRAVVVSSVKADSISFQKDTTRAVVVSSVKADSISFQKDTVRNQHTDVSALDIASNRGIFILSADHMLQLRILGSVRARFNYSDRLMQDNQSFNPYEIPTDNHSNSPNFYAGLNQTRLGFEVTRRTKTRGDIFIRLEGDFNQIPSSYRIRHAYGVMGKLLIGQTWSLFNNVNYQPAIVSSHGPASGSRLRTPQIRYSSPINKEMEWDVGIEYSIPDIDVPDSINGSLLQVIPNITGRYTYTTDLFSFRVAIVLSTISGRSDSVGMNYSFGFGGSFSGWLKVADHGRFFLSGTSGLAVSHFMDLFNGKNQDMAFNSYVGNFEPLVASGGYMAYNHDFPKEFSANISFGMAAITNKDFQPDYAYSYSYNASVNVFYDPVDGARVGAEYAFGQRFDKGGGKGNVSRISILLYYDF